MTQEPSSAQVPPPSMPLATQSVAMGVTLNTRCSFADPCCVRPRAGHHGDIPHMQPQSPSATACPSTQPQPLLQSPGHQCVPTVCPYCHPGWPLQRTPGTVPCPVCSAAPGRVGTRVPDPAHCLRSAKGRAPDALWGWGPRAVARCSSPPDAAFLQAEGALAGGPWTHAAQTPPGGSTGCSSGQPPSPPACWVPRPCLTGLTCARLACWPT